MNNLKLLSSSWKSLLASASMRPRSRPSSSSARPRNFPIPAICLSKDGSAFLAYHPPRDFPYEHSRPLPTTSSSDDADDDSTSPLNIQIVKAFREKTTTKKLTERDLAEMFGETKSLFRPQPQERKRAEVAEYEKMLKRKTLNELPED